eukprot:1931787-Rhodomonas_salina.1
MDRQTDGQRNLIPNIADGNSVGNRACCECGKAGERSEDGARTPRGCWATGTRRLVAPRSPLRWPGCQLWTSEGRSAVCLPATTVRFWTPTRSSAGAGTTRNNWVWGTRQIAATGPTSWATACQWWTWARGAVPSKSQWQHTTHARCWATGVSSAGAIISTGSWDWRTPRTATTGPTSWATTCPWWTWARGATP